MPITAKKLCNLIHEHLIGLGYIKLDDGNYELQGDLSKDRIRDIHTEYRNEVIELNGEFIQRFAPEIVDEYFANGKDVVPEKIQPELVEVHNNESLEFKLFKMASLLSSVPTSQGVGRSLRFVIKDKFNGKVIGVLALADPVFNIKARDDWVGWTFNDRRKRLSQVLDGCKIASIPPYSNLIGGKLIGALMGSQNVLDSFSNRYPKSKKLVMMTTTSALGRSSIYNRLKLPICPKFTKVGWTKGYGHFHLSGNVFKKVQEYLYSIDHPYANSGTYEKSNWKLTAIRATLRLIGMNDEVLNHGIRREMYTIPLCSNTKEILNGDEKNFTPNYLVRPTEEVAEFCVNRWMIPRSKRDGSYLDYDKSDALDTLLNGKQVNQGRLF